MSLDIVQHELRFACAPNAVHNNSWCLAVNANIAIVELFFEFFMVLWSVYVRRDRCQSIVSIKPGIVGQRGNLGV